MKPTITLAKSTRPDGTVFLLLKHDGNYYLHNDGRELMSTARTYSEMLLADAGCSRITEGKATRPEHPRVLIAGLGLGFTLKRTLEIIGRPATVRVAELVEEVVQWNREFLTEENGPLLDDARTEIYQGDFFDCLHGASNGEYDAILYDLDETPDSLVVPANKRLYTNQFLSQFHRALAPDGLLAIWLSEKTPQFARTLRRLGFEVEEIPAKMYPKAKRAQHCILLCRKR